ncbi:hypothetical protein ACWKSP_15095 [Micromonosporaceae bacterium Da 78-11]
MGWVNRRRHADFVAEVRTGLGRLRRLERRFLDHHWPGCDPDGPAPGRLAAPDPAPFRSWVKDPLFGPAFP